MSQTFTTSGGDPSDSRKLLANMSAIGVAILGYAAASNMLTVQQMEDQIRGCAHSTKSSDDFQTCMERQFPLIMKKPLDLKADLAKVVLKKIE